MYLSLYLRRSISRRFQKHFSLYLVLTFSFMLPLLVSVYQDSQLYGTVQEMLFSTKGQTFHIANVTQSDCQYFQGIEGLSSPIFLDGKIHLKMEKDEEWKDLSALNLYYSLLQQRINEMGRSSVSITASEYEYAHGIITDEAFWSSRRLLYAVNLFLIFFMAFIVQSTYRSHLQFFSADMETLSCCGAGRRQITLIFLFEFLTVFALSAASAVLISAGILKLLFEVLLVMQENSGFAWVVFHMDARNTVIHLLICFIALAVPLCFSLRKHPARSASQSGAVPKRYRRKKLAFSRTPSRALAKLWRQRTNRVFQNCLCVSIPLVTVFLFIFQCLLLILSFTSTPAEYEIRVTSAFAGIGDEVINDIEAMEDVAYVVAKKSPSPGEFYIEGPEGEQVPVRIHSFSDLDTINENLEKYDAAVEIDSAAMELKTGDQIRLIRFEGQTGEELFTLTAKQVLASEEGETASDVYIDDVLLTVILNLLPCNELEIKLRDTSRHEAVADALADRFQGAGYKIDDRQTSISFAQNAAPGYYFLTACLFAILFALVILILYTKLCDYVRNQSGIIKTIYTLGSTKDTITRSFLRQASAPALFAALIPILLSFWAVKLVSDSAGAALSWSIPVLAGYLGAGSLMIGVYLCPIQITLRSQFRRLP